MPPTTAAMATTTSSTTTTAITVVFEEPGSSRREGCRRGFHNVYNRVFHFIMSGAVHSGQVENLVTGSQC